MRLLEGKVAVITGSGRGIGRRTALMFAEQGASVVVQDLDRDAAEEAMASVHEKGGKAAFCVGDITTADVPKKIIQTAIDEFGKLDILVNNAGYTWDAMVDKMTDEQWYAMIDIHITAPFHMIQAAAPHMKEAAKQEMERGDVAYHRKIVNITSLAGVTGNVGQTNYSSANLRFFGKGVDPPPVVALSVILFSVLPWMTPGYPLTRYVVLFSFARSCFFLRYSRFYIRFIIQLSSFFAMEN